jgi:hypothetical protein
VLGRENYLLLWWDTQQDTVALGLGSGRTGSRALFPVQDFVRISDRNDPEHSAELHLK